MSLRTLRAPKLTVALVFVTAGLAAGTLLGLVPVGLPIISFLGTLVTLDGDNIRQK